MLLIEILHMRIQEKRKKYLFIGEENLVKVLLNLESTEVKVDTQDEKVFHILVH